jgi:hypothetical protein
LISTTSTIPTGDPVLSVSPESLDFETDEIWNIFSISNTGTGNLAWNINDNETLYSDNGGDWIYSVTPTSGFVTDTPEDVILTVSRRNLTSGDYTAELPIVSSGGDIDLAVNMEVGRIELPVLSAGPQLLLFLRNDVTENTFRITNLLRNGILIWEIGKPVYRKGKWHDWLHLDSASSGYLTSDVHTVTVTVSRDGMGPGVYTATIPVSSNAGNRNITVIMLVESGQTDIPRLKVNPIMLIYLNKDVTESTLTISNSATGTLNWQIDEPVYRGSSDSWISSVTPSTGTITTQEQDITVTINRKGLNPGLHRASIPFISNGGDKKAFVFLLVPFF